MSINLLTYEDKEALAELNNVANKNKIKASDMNSIKSVVNANANLVGDLSNLNTETKSSIVAAINGLATGEIVESLLSENGYIKYSNGFMLQWISIETSLTTSSYGSLFYADVALGDWDIPFTTIFGVIPTNNQAQWISSIGEYTNTNAGRFRCYRPNAASNSNVYLKVLAYGLWK